MTSQTRHLRADPILAMQKQTIMVKYAEYIHGLSSMND